MSNTIVYDSILKFYQKFISPLFGPSCRYYPSCSEYARWQFDTNRPHLAFWNTILRIMRCNKLFDGGIDYPTVKFQAPHILTKNQKKLVVKYWIVKVDKRFKAIKILKKSS